LSTVFKHLFLIFFCEKLIYFLLKIRLVWSELIIMRNRIDIQLFLVKRSTDSIGSSSSFLRTIYKIKRSNKKRRAPHALSTSERGAQLELTTRNTSFTRSSISSTNLFHFFFEIKEKTADTELIRGGSNLFTCPILSSSKRSIFNKFLQSFLRASEFFSERDKLLRKWVCTFRAIKYLRCDLQLNYICCSLTIVKEITGNLSKRLFLIYLLKDFNWKNRPKGGASYVPFVRNQACWQIFIKSLVCLDAKACRLIYLYWLYLFNL